MAGGKYAQWRRLKFGVKAMKIFEKRNNLSISDMGALLWQMPGAIWREWTVDNAVKEGYKASGWVYRAISLIAQNAAKPPIVVYNNNDEIVWDHPITKLFANPNPHFSYNLITQLIVSWLNLSGEAYIYRNIVRNQTRELWPISPDRLEPNLANKTDLVIKYREKNEQGMFKDSEIYTAENIISIKFVDPANPLRGIGPLQVAAAGVDTDNEMRNWNKSAMQNRGVVDGVFTFDRDIQDESTFNLIKKKVIERFSGSDRAREPMIIGSGAKYQKLSLTPVEMDFLDSRKFNREEIFIIFGVPPQLAGITDVMTYNNYAESLKILWESNIIPLLNIISDSLNSGFKNELSPGYYIGHDLSGIPALKQAEKEKAETAKLYFDMGVPFNLLNSKFGFGIEKYDGWDTGKNINAQTAVTVDTGQRNKTGFETPELKLIPFEKRSIAAEMQKRDKHAENIITPEIAKFFNEQREQVFNIIDSGADPADLIRNSEPILREKLLKLTNPVAAMGAATVVTGEKRAALEYPDLAAIVAQDAYMITGTSVDTVIAALSDMITEGKTVQDLKQAILDSGVYSEARALMVARTMAATAMSIGQISGASGAGATHKTWHDSGFEVRPEHVNRAGETVAIADRFSAQFTGSPGPLYPGDMAVVPGDRINCRCAMSFEIRD